MCGIFFIFNQHLLPHSQDEIRQSFMKGRSRGPDNSNISFHDEYIVGFHRLAINGLESDSNQPIKKDKVTLICNGEIYNYKKLYEYLKITPDTHSDCEIIIDMYIKKGIEYTVRCLDGVFAFVIIDERNEDPLYYVGRDVFGVRPLFKLSDYEGNIVGFSSDMKSIIDLKQNDMKIDHYEPNTVSMYEYTDKSWNKTVSLQNSFTFYRENILVTDMFDTSLEKTIDHVKYLFLQSVKKRIENTERKVVCLLSGGLDSSLVASIASKYLKNIETFSIGLDGSEDLKYAKIVSNFIGSKHHEIVVDEKTFFDSIKEVISNIESYDTTTIRASVGNYLVSKYISENSDAKVVLNGDGSDELMGGYLYMHKCPDNISFDEETIRLLRNIHKYDVLRSDKSISSNGLEPRTPFLDRNFTSYYLSIPIELRNHNNTIGYSENIEKYLIRKAFDDGTYLPKEVLWRRKEAFSDGVSSKKRSWYQIIDELVSKHFENKKIDTNSLFSKYAFYKNPPTTLEQLYYRDIFESMYPNCQDVINEFWMPRFVNAKDSSARTLDIYD